MTALLCCLRRAPNMGAALSQPQDGDADGDVEQISPPTMADVIRERKKKAGGATLGTLRRRIAAAARRPREGRQDKGCEHARLIRSVVQNWRLAEVVVLHQQLSAAAALRDLCAQADLARAPAGALPSAAHRLRATRWWCDVELVGAGWSIPAHRAVLAARCAYFRRILHHCTLSSDGSSRVPLSGACAGLPRATVEHVIAALYCASHKTDQSAGSDDELESISEETSNKCGSCECGSRAPPSLLQRLGARLDSLQRDMKYLLDSGEYADASLQFRGEPAAAPLPCHRAILASRSRLFRSIMSRHGPGSACSVVVDSRVLPRRFAPALLHAAYTDQVDLTLIGRPSSPNGTTTNNTTTSWSSLGRGGAASKPTTAAMLEDAFQLYEIASFVEMPIAVQGCEDAIIEALSPETLPTVLRWSAAPAASHWVHRQAMRYLLDEFPACLAGPAGARLPPAALRAALTSPFLQCSEHAALRAALRWAAARESPTLGGRRRGGRRGVGAGGRHALRPLLPHVRTEHIPPHNDVLQQAIRRGLVSEACPAWCSADAWLGRGLYRPARCLLPYLDALQTLVEGVRVPESELARVRRAKCLTRMPDTLYMVGSTREPPLPALSVEERSQLLATLPPSLRGALRGRCHELRRGAAAVRAALHHPQATAQQIALRAVRERSLPDACAELLLPDLAAPSGSGADSAAAGGEAGDGDDWDCCRSEDGAQGGVNDEAGGSRNDTLESNRRRELPALVSEGQVLRGGVSPAAGSAARLSRCVPDVLAPNANTHLLNYPAHTELVGAAAPVLQLDLGDGATHSPRPGSRAQRQARQQREQSQLCGRARADDDDLRAAIEMSVIRAYSYNQCSSPVPPYARPRPPRAPSGPLDLVGPYNERTNQNTLERIAHSNERLERNNTLDRLNTQSSERSISSINSQIDRLSGTLERLSGTQSVQSGTLERTPLHTYSSNLERNNSFTGIERNFGFTTIERNRYNTIERSHSSNNSVGNGTLERSHSTLSKERRTPERVERNAERQMGTIERNGIKERHGNPTNVYNSHNYYNSSQNFGRDPNIGSIDRRIHASGSHLDVIGGSSCQRDQPCLQNLGSHLLQGPSREGTMPHRDLSTGSLHRDVLASGGHREPVGGHREPGVGHREPGVGHREPGVGHREPAGGGREPQGVTQRTHSYRRRSREREAVLLSVHQGATASSPAAVGARPRLGRADGSERDRRSPRQSQYARYNLEAPFPNSASSSRGPSPNNYA